MSFGFYSMCQFFSLHFILRKICKGTTKGVGTFANPHTDIACFFIIGDDGIIQLGSEAAILIRVLKNVSTC